MLNEIAAIRRFVEKVRGGGVDTFEIIKVQNALAEMESEERKRIAGAAFGPQIDIVEVAREAGGL